MTELAPVTLQPIGLVRSPFADIEGMPIQAAASVGLTGTIELDPAYGEGLADLEGFSHLILLYHLHRVRAPRLTVTPFLDAQPRGVFATRSPTRPNAIGLSTVRLLAIRGTTLDIADLDILDGTPLLDIKPYVPAFDDRSDARIGWFAGRADLAGQTKADGRFR